MQNSFTVHGLDFRVLCCAPMSCLLSSSKAGGRLQKKSRSRGKPKQDLRLSKFCHFIAISYFFEQFPRAVKSQ